MKSVSKRPPCDGIRTSSRVDSASAYASPALWRPKFIVADEPVSALDVSVGARVVNLLRDLQRRYQLTYLFISHSMPIVRYLSTRIAVMQAGKIVELGAAEQVTSAPKHEYTKKLLAATPEVAV